MDLIITEVNTSRQRAEIDSCLTCVSIIPWKYRPFLLRQAYKFTAQCAALSLVKKVNLAHQAHLSLSLSLSFRLSLQSI